MCIEKDNSAVKGTFFHDQGYPRALQVFSPGGRGKKHNSFHSSKQTASSSSYNGAYQLGDMIAAFRISDQGGTATSFGGYLVVPSAGDGGKCIELNSAVFGKNEANACLKQTDNLALDCEHQFSTTRYVSNIFGTFDCNEFGVVINPWDNHLTVIVMIFILVQSRR